jgi:hypothetical protein
VSDRPKVVDRQTKEYAFPDAPKLAAATQTSRHTRLTGLENMKAGQYKSKI